eukprot:CAMPEP_0114619382 /NCGR_PEP_ID=MMETSP0168-20121206/8186_1 /TAXON_ID=95228 ORGANISM="Vannella sp., Strain DIVA3 517/6/12" /NCGR_SAMPLE_ID=MMETSP0168 /ASSEMBLY_ACC=CAM_ASM_000044 /LENGTH=476 /DNA_ID=CAMNT_0001830551 /DNA_START=166 /DNA_END=1596 /DNA_ORIENTATION=+
MAGHMATGYSQVDLCKATDPFCRLLACLEELKKMQRRRKGGLPAPPPEPFTKLTQWLGENGVDVASFPVAIAADIGQEGSGLVARRDLTEGELLVSIPERLLLSLQSADENGVGELKAKVLDAIPSVKLALHLWMELQKPKSFWKPYIDSLPRTLSLPIFWTVEELQSLRGTIVQGDALKSVVTTAMQYIHVFQEFQRLERKRDILAFSYEEWAWCVGIVMSRQNKVPLGGSGRPQPTLIPFWDLFNHSKGEITTFWNTEHRTLDSLSMESVKEGEQAYMHYGYRHNGLLLLYQGFVYDDNIHDCITVPYSILSDEDKLKPAKAAFLMKHETHNMKVTFKKGEEIAKSRAMLASRISVATMEEVKALNAMEEPMGKEVSLDNEVKAVQLLTAALDYVVGLRETVRNAGPKVEEEKEITPNAALGHKLYALEEAILTEARRQLDASRTSLKRRAKNRKKKQSKRQKAVMQTVVDDVD